MPDLFLSDRHTAAEARPLLLWSRDEFSRRARRLLGDCPVVADERFDGPVEQVGLGRLLLYRLVTGDHAPPRLPELAALESVDQAYHLYATAAAAAAAEPSRPTHRRGRSHDLLAGDFVTLRPLALAHLDWLTAVLTHPEVIHRPPARGVPPSPEMLLGLLNERLLCQFVVTGADASPVGLVRAVDADLHSRHAHLEFVFAPSAVVAAWPLEGAMRFVDYCFQTFGLRKLYVEVDAEVYRRLPAAAHELLHLEGVLRDHRDHLGAWVDVAQTCLWRDEWSEQRSRWLPVGR
jgi:RimJ/RimL family protein N-acetyltransferase